MKDLKAIFFVKDFMGNPEHRESQHVEASGHGRKIEVALYDGEKLVGTTEGYNPQKPSFFMVPADPESNNIRIFVIRQNAREVKLI